MTADVDSNVTARGVNGQVASAGVRNRDRRLALRVLLAALLPAFATNLQAFSGCLSEDWGLRHRVVVSGMRYGRMR